MRIWIILILVALAGCRIDTPPTPDDVVRKAFNLLRQAPYYTEVAAAATVNRSNGEFEVRATQYTVWHQAPDRYHLNMVNGPEIIVIGNTGWSNEGDQGWVPLLKVDPDPRTLSRLLQPGEISGFRFLAKEKTHGLDVYVQKGDTDVFVYIDPASGELRDMGIIDDFGSLDYRYDYKTPVAINAP